MQLQQLSHHVSVSRLYSSSSSNMSGSLSGSCCGCERTAREHVPGPAEQLVEAPLAGCILPPSPGDCNTLDMWQAGLLCLQGVWLTR